MSRETIPRAALAGVLLCFFASGAAGLIYQVAWGKALGLVFGHTVYAVAVVLAVFMGGLAAGSAVLGRWGERFAQPVALYGWIELAIAALGALSLAGIAGVRAMYVAAFPWVEGTTAGQVGLRLVGAAVVLFLPTFLMGGTLPILVRGLTQHSAELAARVSRLYWVNTAGAAAGTLAAGFLLVPALGLKRTVAVAVALNVLAGVVALRLDRRTPPVPVPVLAGKPPAPRLSRFLLLCFAVVGATAMAYEIAWTRMLAVMLGSSTYAFTVMLATFLTGIVLGSMLFERWARGGREIRAGSFATTQMLTAAAAFGFLLYYERLPELVRAVLSSAGQDFGGLLATQLATAALAMLPAAVVFGFNFPLATVLIAGSRPEAAEAVAGHGAAVGRAYAANTVGAIAGALAVGFWLLPAVGAFHLVMLAAAANLGLALLLEAGSAERRLPALATSLALGAVLAVVAASGVLVNPALSTFAAALYWDIYPQTLTVREIAETTDVIFARDGLNASVTVVRTEDYLALRSNGKVDASNRDAVTQLMAGHVGALAHPAPRRVLVIGLGSGMTVSAVARHPEVERIVCVEIEPAVLEAARFLGPLHRGVLADPRLEMVLDDARNFLLTTREEFDLIISEPSNPWIAGISSLFTEEFYREARARLAPGGVFVQWVQAYSLAPEDLRMVLATFVPQFPRVTLWRGDSPDLLLVAEIEPRAPSLERVRRLWELPPLREDFERVGMTRPEGLLAFYLLDDAALRAIAEGAARNTDDHTRLEYRAPRTLLDRDLEEHNYDLIEPHRRSPLPEDLALEDRIGALVAIAEVYLALEERDRAARVLALVPQPDTRADAALARGRLALERNQFDVARAALERALVLEPERLEAPYLLGRLARRQLNLDAAELMYRQVLNRRNDHVDALHGMAYVANLRQQWADAARWQTLAIAARGEPDADALADLGDFQLAAGDAESAVRSLRLALNLEPYSYKAHYLLGHIYSQQRRWDDSRRHLEAVIRYHPEMDAGPYALLYQVYHNAGEPRLARAALRKGRRLFPNHREFAALPAD